jgi:multidrug efflux pump subunit AcrA (membrane-fusion protein)
MANENGHHAHTRTAVKNEPTKRTATPRQEKRGGGGLGWLGLIVLLFVLGGAVCYILWKKQNSETQLESNTEKMSVPTVLIVHPQPGDPHVHLTLPGTVNSLIESSVYAQVSGYIKRWLVDIGEHVKEGQLLAEIDTPVTDQQLKQAAESVKLAQANLDLAKATAERYNGLFASHAVSQQDIDNQNASVKVQEANLSSAQAFEGGIEKTESFKEVKAPFDGIVTARKIDVGDYVSATGQTGANNAAGSGPAQSGTPNQELFRVAQTKTLRVYVDVPENYADQFVPGTKATLDLASAPNQTVAGKLVRTANAIDPASLTLLAEVDVDNADEKLLPGGYAQVHFDIQTSHPPLVIPGNSLIFRQQGTQVGVVGDDGIVHLRNIKIGRDLGTKLEVVDGIQPTDRVIVNPSDSLADGQKVNVTESNAQGSNTQGSVQSTTGDKNQPADKSPPKQS